MAYIYERFGATYAGGEALPLRVITQPVGAGSVPSSLVSLPGGGSWDNIGTSVSRPRAQLITVSGMWLAASKSAMETKMDALKALVGTRNKLWASVDSGTTNRWRYARCLDVRSMAQVGIQNRMPIEMDFELAASNWNGAAHSESTELATGSDEITSTNGGNVRASNAVITVTADTSNITVLSVLLAGVVHWHYTGTITASKSLVVDCGTRKVTNDGTGDFAHFVLQSDHADNDWMPMLSGVNTYTVANTGGGAESTILIAYADGWA